MIIFVDDIRQPFIKDSVVFREVTDELFLFISNHWNEITEIYLDHDLGDEHKTGYDVILFLENYVYNNNITHLPDIKVHSSNSSARVKMELGIKSIKRLLDKKGF